MYQVCVRAIWQNHATHLISPYAIDFDSIIAARSASVITTMRYRDFNTFFRLPALDSAHSVWILGGPICSINSTCNSGARLKDVEAKKDLECLSESAN
jgi:hypothetical protein